METGVFEKPVLLTPDYCSRSAAMSPLAAFTIFQGIASEHAELIGVGGAAMAKRGEFWLTVHSRVPEIRAERVLDKGGVGLGGVCKVARGQPGAAHADFARFSRHSRGQIVLQEKDLFG